MRSKKNYCLDFSKIELPEMTKEIQDMTKNISKITDSIKNIDFSSLANLHTFLEDHTKLVDKISTIIFFNKKVNK